jgi:hypothetical protein
MFLFSMFNVYTFLISQNYNSIAAFLFLYYTTCSTMNHQTYLSENFPKAHCLTKAVREHPVVVAYYATKANSAHFAV